MAKAGRMVGEPPMDTIRRGHLHYNLLKRSLAIPGPGAYNIQSVRLCKDPHDGVIGFDSCKNEFKPLESCCSSGCVKSMML